LLTSPPNVATVLHASSHCPHSEAGEPSIYDYVDSKAFLEDTLAFKKTKNKNFSIRAWSRQLGFKTPSLLNNILKGERRLGSDLVKRLTTTLHLSSAEQHYFEMLVQYNQATTQCEKDLLQDRLNQLRPDPAKQDLKLSHFKLISDWHHLAILEVFSVEGFAKDPDVLAKKLRNKITPDMALHSISILSKLGLLMQTDSGIARGPGNPVLKDEVPHEAIKMHHKQMLDLAKEAIVEQSVEERNLRSSKVAICRDKLPEVKEIIKECHQRIQKLSTSQNADCVYAFNSQLFLLSE
jgi:uncharacterized protein (TIGR02147 family)